ncbi:hypothetical protein AGR9A_Lc20055 [Agrobacterium salinitolerans str. Hayward 0363]|nr:hypothetical protein AGR9A_Lc20055 [Agrobacterium salinitolerans str. Hayward 0363]
MREAGITIGVHLAAINLGLKTIPVDRRRHRSLRPHRHLEKTRKGRSSSQLLVWRVNNLSSIRCNWCQRRQIATGRNNDL